jgi:acylphosphatase
VAAHEGRGLTLTGNTQRLEATVRGIVQGVGFRWFVVRTGKELGLTGWAANERDGSVRVVAEGEAAALDDLERRLYEGPPAAYVRGVDVVRMPGSGEFNSFSIRSSSHRGD